MESEQFDHLWGRVETVFRQVVTPVIISLAVQGVTELDGNMIDANEDGHTNVMQLLKRLGTEEFRLLPPEMKVSAGDNVISCRLPFYWMFLQVQCLHWLCMKASTTNYIHQALRKFTNKQKGRTTKLEQYWRAVRENIFRLRHGRGVKHITKYYELKEKQATEGLSQRQQKQLTLSSKLSNFQPVYKSLTNSLRTLFNRLRHEYLLGITNEVCTAC